MTITDSHSRFLIETRIAAPTVEGSQAVFTRAFAAYGLPLSIRCDNGAPFGSPGAGGLTRLSAWWLKLGVEPHFIRPASPQENGRHERMHRTLKKETSQPPAADAEEQQARFDDFRQRYNEIRPHEALGQTPPAERYQPSPRALPERVEDPWYDADHEVRRVRTRGEVKWRGEFVFVSEADRRTGRARRTRDRRPRRPLLRTRPRDHRSPRLVPPFRSAPYGAPLHDGTSRKPKTVDHQPGPNCRGSTRLNTTAERGLCRGGSHSDRLARPPSFVLPQKSLRPGARKRGPGGGGDRARGELA